MTYTIGKYLRKVQKRADELHQILSLDPSLNFILEPKEIESIWERGGTKAVNNLFRRAAVHAKHVIICSHFGPDDEEDSSYAKLVDKKVQSYQQVLEKPEWFPSSELSKYEISEEDFSARGIYYYLPYYNFETQMIFDKETVWGKKSVDLNILLSDDFLRYQLAEGKASNKDELKIFRFLLPSISNVPLETLLSLRLDHRDSFVRLNKAEYKLTKSLFNASSTEAATNILKEVDSYIQEYQNKVNQIKRKHYKSLSLISFGALAMSIPIILPVEISKLLAGVIGGFSFKDFFIEQFGIWDKKKEIQEDEMYFAALVHNESKS